MVILPVIIASVHSNGWFIIMMFIIKGLTVITNNAKCFVKSQLKESRKSRNESHPSNKIFFQKYLFSKKSIPIRSFV